MGWSGGNYTKWNTGTGGWAGDAAAGTGIVASRHDQQDDDFQNGINQCLTKNGANLPTANLPMNSYKHTNVADATAATEYMAYGQIRNGSPLYMDTANKRLGIGTSTPQTTLDLQGTGDVQITVQEFNNNTSAGFLQFNKSRGATVGANTIVQNGDELGTIQFSGANGTGYTPAAAISCSVNGTPGATNDMPGALGFSTTSDGAGLLTERMKIASNGRVGIGAGTPTAKLDVFNDESNAIAVIRAVSNVTGDVAQPALNILKRDNDSTTSQVFVQFVINNAASGSGQINANGANQATFGSFSDARLKENIIDLSCQLENILSLRPVEFDYKDGSGHQIGFIAQEVQQIYPDLIGQVSNGMLTLSGLGKNEARIIKALQELSAKVKVLEEKLNATNSEGQ